jgi:hypothetical protein
MDARQFLNHGGHNPKFAHRYQRLAQVKVRHHSIHPSLVDSGFFVHNGWSPTIPSDPGL